MNKIIVSKNGIFLNDNKLKNNIINLIDNNDYTVEYIDDGNYEITFNINGNIKINENSFDKNLNLNNKYIIESGYLNIYKFYNNHTVNEIINIDLCTEKSKVDYHFSNICRENEHYIININHKCKNTISNIINKSIALKNSNLKFIINSNVYKESIKSILNQNTRIVTMDKCDTSISPNMFIDLNDVEAKHGSVIGSFNQDQIFYLMSKGINYNDTLKLLIKGYIFSNVDIDNDLRLKILEIINLYWR